ncbi:MAG: nucleoid-associated protein, YbaB/EbfC family [Spirochaetes bacterium GWB1_36_13]|nr:MAG: nucleoid-associated protein, YbaB/EbfC family [Spirochaetes bacterium GWB1_36_13]
MFDFGNIMKQVKGFKDSIDTMKKSMEDKTVEGSSGGGMVKAVITGAQKVKKIILSDEILAENDKEMLEAMITAAVNDGLSRADEMVKTEMGSLASSMGLPLNGLL